MEKAHSLDDLKRYHNEATQFFASELMLLKEAIPNISDERLGKASMLLISAGQTGAALLQLANQTDTHTGESVMLARAFMEKITNFCYVGICDEKEYQAFLLHPIYKHYHNVGFPKMEDSLGFTSPEEYMDLVNRNLAARKSKQDKLKEIPIVQEALTAFSDTKTHLNWTKKTMGQRIDAIAKWGKLMDVFFSINKIQYYSDASETLHGSLYGCTYQLGIFDPEFDYTNEEELSKRLYKDSTCILLHLGMLIHESFTLISYANDIKDIWQPSYNNRRMALNLLFHVLGRTLNSIEKNNHEG
jgi:hypothetical protein